MKKRGWLSAVALLTIAVIGSERQAHAMMYTDPGSGAMLWQLGVAAFMGMMFYVSRLHAWIRRKIFREKSVVQLPDRAGSD